MSSIRFSRRLLVRSRERTAPIDQRSSPWTRERIASLFILLLALEVGAAVRFFLVLRADFPLNDGGLFLVMIENLRAAYFHLPAYTSYNALDIPFAYPPLAFYVAALLAQFFGWSPLAILQWLPAVVSTATIVPFYYLARLFLRSRRQAAYALIAFVFVPRSYDWEIMGGGLTRSFGFFFALWTIYFAYRLYTSRRRRYVAACAAMGALTLLSHLEMGWFAALSAVLFFLFLGRNRRGFIHSLAVTAGIVGLTAPWWGSVIRAHGLAPFTAAVQTGSHSFLAWMPLLLLNFADEPFSRVFEILGILGLFTFMARGRSLAPVWVLVLFLLDPRKAATVTTVPLSLAIGLALDEMILPRITAETKKWLPKLLLGILLAHAVLSQFSLPFFPGNPARVLPAAEREAMAWTARETPADSRFVVIGSDGVWPRDATAEWFPVLAQRVSETTVQGTEWLPGRRFEAMVDRYDDLQECAAAGIECVTEWAAQYGVDFSHIYVSKSEIRLGMNKTQDCCGALRQSIAHSPAYQVLYDGPGALIAVRRQP